MVLGLLLPGAVSGPGRGARPSTPSEPIPYADQWLEIQPGEFQWYAFKYREAEENRPLEISLYTRGGDGIRLLLLNGDQVRVWQQGGKLEHFGEATPVYRHVEEPVSKDEYCREKPDADICVDPGDGGGGVPCPNDDEADSDDCYLLDVPEPRGFRAGRARSVLRAASTCWCARIPGQLGRPNIR